MTKHLLVLCVLFCSACASIPKKLELPENTTTVNFSNAKAQISDAVGQTARWGGVIAAIKNNADTTMLEVVNFPLASNLRPKKGDETLGRFRVYFNGLLDPVIYKEGRSITAVGTLAELEAGKIGEHEYNFPVIKDASVHLWEKIERVDVSVIHQPFWHYNNPYFWSGAHLGYHRPMVLRTSVSKPNQTQPSKPNQSSANR